MMSADNCQFSSGKSTYVDVPVRYLWCVWWRICAEDVDYCRNGHTGVWTLIFLAVFIPEDKLVCWPLNFNSIHTSFVDYSHLYVLMVFHRGYQLTWYLQTLHVWHGWFFINQVWNFLDNNYKILWYISFICQSIIFRTII